MKMLGRVVVGCLALAVGRAAVAGESVVTSVAGWSMTKTDRACSFTPPYPPRTPSLHVDVLRSDGSTRINVMGLPLPEGYVPGEWLEYRADAAIALNGNPAFTAKGMKFERFFDLEGVDYDKLRSIAAPGKVTFEFKGAGGRGETIEFESPGLEIGLDFLKECLGR